MKNLLALIAAIDPAAVKLPSGKIKLGDRVVGTLTPDLVRLYGLVIKTSDEFDLLREENQKKMLKIGEGHICDNGPECEKHSTAMTNLLKEISDAQDNLLALREIWWKTVQMEFNILNENSIGLRENGQVVVSDPDLGEEFVGGGQSLLSMILSAALSRRN